MASPRVIASRFKLVVTLTPKLSALQPREVDGQRSALSAAVARVRHRLGWCGYS
jgi:hypothetical protein